MTTRLIQHLRADPDGKYKFSKMCIHCRGYTTITCDPNKFHRWHVEMHLIQNVWPDLTSGQREIMISGMHEACWDEVFAHTEDDGEDEELNAISEGRDTNNRWW